MPARRLRCRWLPLLVLVGAAGLPLQAMPAAAQGIPFIGGLLRRPAKAPPPGPSAPVVEGSTPEQDFQRQLRSSDLNVLNLACQEAAAFNFETRMRLLRDRLLVVAPSPQPFETVLVNANALLSCRAPDAALTVLNRFGPKPGVERQQWWMQRWRAASAGLHHRLAAEALQQLAQGQWSRLETIALPLQSRDDGSLVTRPALDVLADHLVTLGRDQEAATVLLAGRLPGRPAAERLQRAVALLGSLPPAERSRLLDIALDQAAADGAWGLAAALLRDQQELQAASGLSTARTQARQQRLSQRIDDAYSAWQSSSQDPKQAARAAQLQQQLRSPRAPGGHAASQP